MPRRPVREQPAASAADDDFIGDAAPPQLREGPMSRISALTSAARELIDYISGTDVAEVELQSGPIKIAIRRANANPPPPQMMPMTAYAETMLPSPATPREQGGYPTEVAATPTEPVAHPNAHAVTSPMVGTFYHAPSPKDRPYAVEGEHVDKGQTIGLIEAMKMMNEIEADISGTIVKIVAANSQPVEYGQPLVLIEPDPQ